MTEGADTSPVRVLYIEDDPGQARIFQKKLEKSGYVVDVSENGTDGLSRCAESVYDVVAVDQTMPDMDGLEVIRRLSSLESRLPAIMITGSGDERTAAEAMKLGARDYIVKDLELGYLDLLPSVIDRVLTEQRIIQERNNALAALREKDRRYRLLIDNSGYPVAFVDKEGVLLLMNKAASANVGGEPDDFIGKSITELFPEAGGLYMKRIRQVSDSTEGRQYEDIIDVPSGRRWFWFNLQPVIDPDGGLFAVQIISQDITARKEAEEELERYRNQLEELVEQRTLELKEANKSILRETAEKLEFQRGAMRSAHLAALGEMAAGVAHEVNNPINGIINYAQILTNMSSADTRENDIARRILKEGDRIASIVRSLLSFGRGGEKERCHVRVHEILSDTLALSEAQIRKDNIRLTVDLAPGLPAVYVNPPQIQQVFLNLIINSRHALNQRHAGDDGAKNLLIRGGIIKTGEITSVRITFRDNGAGIPVDVLEKVMNPFFTTKPVGEGTGLGLSISYGIISVHGGVLEINSCEGEYTEVTVDLPPADYSESPRTGQQVDRK